MFSRGAKERDAIEKKGHHFSHPHPLKPIAYQQTLNLTSPCAACKLKPSGMIYTCTVCKDYFLHKQCFEMPRKIDHLCHEKPLTLLPKTGYAKGYFVCDGCGQTGDGFSYNCDPCGYDLHMLCALMPLFATHESHVHKLDLTFESPEPTKSFACGICGNPGSRQLWLYRCKLCEFNAHLNCARGLLQPSSEQQPMKDTSFNTGFDEPTKTPPETAAAATGSRLAPSVPQLPAIQQQKQQQQQQKQQQQQQSIMNDVPKNDLALLAVQKMIVSRSNGIAQAVQQMIVNNSDAIAQGILTSGSGNGGGGFGGESGEKRELHLLTELICILTNGGGGGGGGQSPVNNSGGGGSGGGGGRRDSARSLPGDGNAWY